MTRAAFVPLLLAALILPGAPHAQTPPAPVIRGTLYLIAPRTFDRTDPHAIKYSVPLITTPAGLDSPTAIDHRFAPEGLAASVGFVCDNDGHIPVLHGVAAGAEPGRLIGTTLRVGF